MLGMMREMKASLALSILDSIRQRGLSTEAAADVAGLDVERMRALVERRELRGVGVDELGEILDAIDASGPKFWGKS